MSDERMGLAKCLQSTGKVAGRTPESLSAGEMLADILPHLQKFSFRRENCNKICRCSLRNLSGFDSQNTDPRGMI